MKIRNIGPNQTEVALSNGDFILISYATPAAIICGKNKTGKHIKFYPKLVNGVTIMTPISKTTKKHIEKFFNFHSCAAITGYVVDTDLQEMINRSNGVETQ